MFRVIDMERWPRKEHYAYYRDRLKCTYSLTASLDVTSLVNQTKEKNLKFYPVFVYCAARVVNATPEFRMGTDPEGNPGYWDVMHPSYTIFHEDDHTFSDVWTYYNEDFGSFYQAMTGDMKTYGSQKGVKVKDGQPPNFFCISCVPWISYSGYHTSCVDASPNLFPILTFGKYEEKNGKTEMPFTVTIGHAAADGYHTAHFIQDVQNMVNEIQIEIEGS